MAKSNHESWTESYDKIGSIVSIIPPKKSYIISPLHSLYCSLLFLHLGYERNVANIKTSHPKSSLHYILCTCLTLWGAAPIRDHALEPCVVCFCFGASVIVMLPYCGHLFWVTPLLTLLIPSCHKDLSWIWIPCVKYVVFWPLLWILTTGLSTLSIIQSIHICICLYSPHVIVT